MKISKLTLATLGTLALATPAVAQGATEPTVPSAQEQCRTERAGMGTDTFKQTYGTNQNRSNAFGKCVSKRNAATRKAASEARTNAAKECKSERKADPAAFRAKYGTNGKGSNAFGKCVSAQAKAQQDEAPAQS